MIYPDTSTSPHSRTHQGVVGGAVGPALDRLMAVTEDAAALEPGRYVGRRSPRACSAI